MLCIYYNVSAGLLEMAERAEGADKWLKVAVKVRFEIVDSYLSKTDRDHQLRQIDG